MLKKIAVVTGANAGLGFQITLALAGMGMRVVMACRNMDKAESARQGILAQMPDADVLVIPLDVSEPDSIKVFTEQFSEQIGTLDVLVNNAGIVGMPLMRNSRGQEMHLATNYLGSFALTGRLLPFLRDDPQSRIVNVGSLAHLFGNLNLDDFNWEQQDYNQWRAYARSKLALLTFTMALGRKLADTGNRAVVLGAHPGFAATEILGDRVTNPGSAISKWYMENMTKLIPTPESAARAILHAACSHNVSSGEYYGPGGFLGIAGEPGKARLSKRANDMTAARQLWAVSESMSGVSFLTDKSA